MQFLHDGAARRSFTAAKVRRITLPLLLSLVLAACGGGGSGGATGGFSDAFSDKSPTSSEAVTLTPISSIPSTPPTTTTSTTSAPTSGVTLAPISGIPTTAPTNTVPAPAPTSGVPLAPITGIPTTDPGVAWGPLSRTFGDPPFKLNGPSGVTQPLVFTSGNTGVATISGNTVTIVGAGTTSITAKSASTTGTQYLGTIAVYVKKARPNLSMPTVTVPAIDGVVKLQASTKSTGAIQYALSNVVSTDARLGVGVLDSDGTFRSWGVGTALITATQVPSANYEGGTVTGQLIVEKRKYDIPLNDMIQPFTYTLQIPVEVATYDEVSGEFRTPTFTVSNPAMSAVWDEVNYWIRVDVRSAGSTFLTLSLGATTNLAPVSKTVTLTFTEVTQQQPGRQLTKVEGNNAYKEDYVFDAEKKVVTLKLCPSTPEVINLSFTDSPYNEGAKHVSLNGVDLAPVSSWGEYAANVQAIATGDAPLKLQSFVDGSSGGGVNLIGTVFEYDVKVELLDPLTHTKCYRAGPV